MVLLKAAYEAERYKLFTRWPLFDSGSLQCCKIGLQKDTATTGSILTRDAQIRQGSARGPPLRGGGPIVGDNESVRQEFREVFTKARGREGEELRANAKTLAEQSRMERDGRADHVIRERASI